MVMFEALEDIWVKVRDLNEYSKALVTFATTVGAIVIIHYTLNILYYLYRAFRLYCLSQSQCLSNQNLPKKYGQWAVISGSTDGIGLAMARELARRGMSIIVIGRNEEKLANTKSSLENEPNAGEILTIKIDLSDSSLENFARIRPLIDPDNRDIGILINNAGTFPSKFQRFNKFDEEHLKVIVNLNILATLYLTRMIMPGMVERGKGLLVNVSSSLGSFTTPYLSVYGATKTFIDAFTKQLQVEYSEHPIDIVDLTPGAVHTKLLIETSTLPRPSMLNPSPEDYARISLNALSAGQTSYCGTAFHEFTYDIGAFFQKVGLLPSLFRLNMRQTARNFELSPVPKRKRPAQESGTQGSGDEARENLQVGN